MRTTKSRYSDALLGVVSALLVASVGFSSASPVATSRPIEDYAPYLWAEDQEAGNNDGWSYIAISGDAEARVTTERAHTGRYANRLTIWNADGQGTSPGVRMEKHRGIPGYDGEENLPREAYYSVYFYFPQYVGHDGWFWNVFQWKRAFITNGGSHSRHPTWVINVLDSGPNRMTFMLERKVDANNKYQPYGTREATAPIDVPTGQWVHLECFYKWSMNADGRITCWQDGTKIWDITNAETDLDYPYLFDKWQWSVNNYAADTTPTSHSLWIDDAAISTQRLGPNWIDGSPAVGDGDCAGLVPTIVGTPSDDRIVGTPGRDVILARGGHDVIFGRGGNDVICAGSGDDIVLAGPGRDFVYGGRGADRLSGRAGFDRLYGRHGSDRMFGGAGPDLCVGGTGRDRAASCETRR